MTSEGPGLTGNHFVRAIRPARSETERLFPRIRDRMELRAQALKLRYWPLRNPTDQSGRILDLDWSWIAALRGLRIGELRVDDLIGGQDNIRIIFFDGGKIKDQAWPVLWVLRVMQKKRNDFSTYDLAIFRAGARWLLSDSTRTDVAKRKEGSRDGVMDDLPILSGEKEVNMSATHKKKKGVENGANLMVSKMFADVFQAYLECSDEVQLAIRDMVGIVKSEGATPEERDAAIETIAEALFPSTHEEELGVDIERFPDNGQVDVKAALRRMDEEDAAFGKRLDALLTAKSMTQAELADAIGVRQSAVSMMISRECRPQRRTIEKIAQALRVSPEDLWPGFNKEE